MPAVAQGSFACTDPVFVLCTSRSGSTLLRFVLDAHPDLACPPEMKLPNVLAQLARLWSATDALGSPGAENGGGPAVSPAAAAGIRHTLDLMIGPYLARRGKKRYCDKPRNRAARRDFAGRVPGGEVHLPVSPSDGHDLFWRGGVPVGAEPLRVRAICGKCAREHGSRTGQVLDGSCQRDPGGGGPVPRQMSPGAVRRSGRRP